MKQIWRCAWKSFNCKQTRYWQIIQSETETWSAKYIIKGRTWTLQIFSFSFCTRISCALKKWTYLAMSRAYLTAFTSSNWPFWDKYQCKSPCSDHHLKKSISITTLKVICFSAPYLLQPRSIRLTFSLFRTLTYLYFTSNMILVSL